MAIFSSIKRYFNRFSFVCRFKITHFFQMGMGNFVVIFISFPFKFVISHYLIQIIIHYQFNHNRSRAISLYLNEESIYFHKLMRRHFVLLLLWIAKQQQQQQYHQINSQYGHSMSHISLSRTFTARWFNNEIYLKRKKKERLNKMEMNNNRISFWLLYY